jgi:dTMP kinase
MSADQAAGLFISLEGMDASGKSTQLQLLVQRLEAESVPYVVNREPGGSPIGQQIRGILLQPENTALSPVTELLLYFANRAQNVDQVIRPALADGKLVLSDRYTDSTIAYQGAARGLGVDVVRQLHSIACRQTEPNLTFYVRVSPEVSAARLSSQAKDRLENEGAEFHRRVFDAYEALAAAEPERVVTIDGNRPPQDVAESIWAIVKLRWTARVR